MITRRPPYFAGERLPDGGPAPVPLVCVVERVVRFEEVDPLNVMWHGRYPSYFEDARVALGRRYGLGYQEVYDAGLVIPVKQMGIDYILPLRFGERCRITASLHWCEAARLNFSYAITAESGALATTGYTVQLFLSHSQELYMVKPDHYQHFCARWESGALASDPDPRP